MPSTARIQQLEPARASRPCPTPFGVASPPVPAAQLTLPSGRSVRVRAAAAGDEIVVRAPGGATLLRIELTAAGAVVSLDGPPLELRTPAPITLAAAEVEIHAERDLRLSAGRRVAIDCAELELGAAGSMQLRAGGDLRAEVTGSHHLRVGQAEQIEAARIELQANDASIGMRAMHGIALDAEHIGLNDDPCPEPFAWSALASDSG